MTVYGADVLVVLALKAGLPIDKARTAAAIGMAESGGDTTAHNTKGCDDSYGLWQINMLCNRAGCTDRLGKLVCLGPARRAQLGLNADSDLFDPATNAKAMAKISSGGNDFTAWTTYTSGAYKGHLADANAAGASQGVLGDLPGAIKGAIPDPFKSATQWVSDLLGGFKNIAITSLAVLLGIGLIGAGAWRGVKGALPPGLGGVT